MAILTLCFPDDKHERLKALAANRQISVNELIDELATVAIANHDARLGFAPCDVRGDLARAMKGLQRPGHR